MSYNTTSTRIIPEPHHFHDPDFSYTSFPDSEFDDTLSLTSSVFDYVYENGRRYCSNRFGNGTECIMPNDDEECERLEMVSHCWNLLLEGELKLVPLRIDRKQRRHDEESREEEEVVGKLSSESTHSSGSRRGSGDEYFRVLDLGTGTGTWAIQFGDAYPNSTVYGIDVSPIQNLWVPPNVKFEVDNFEDDECWEAYRKPFDFIHGRNLVGSVRDWPKLFRNIYDGLAPGGAVEFQESDAVGAYSEDGSVPKNSAIIQYNELLTEAGKRLGQRFDVVAEIKEYMKQAGFVDVREHRYKLPIGKWPKDTRMKELGVVAQEIMQTGVEAYALACLTRVLGWDARDAQAFLDKALEEFNNRRMHTIYTMYVVHGRKPEEGEL
ncbi:S-adenosyl-L-methionine-dependent methyltransferase [Ascobolus immersus RN42]|uniref:S-adenosyl-L-methionine-dependent methyltransferase n=1 Tax=Ascobolus immersus RN42 TaxID=1160509 RepID=A0A3N4IJK6_ASCIM|nr:S-adenosyl-L-methionine-dependent methyltransferase [Ascobolus immersus RN42]